MSTPDLDAFEERAAIHQFDGGMSRFQAETLAAQAQGLTSWQVLKELENAHRSGNPPRGGYPMAAMAGELGPHDLPAVQSHAQACEPEDPGAQHHQKAGRTGLALSPLRA